MTRERIVKVGRKVLKIVMIGMLIVRVVLLFVEPHLAHAASPPWTITTHYGELDEVHSKPHEGIDFAVPIGTEIDSITDGTVVDVRNEGTKSWGKSIIIRTGDKLMIYGHLSKQFVHVGEHVHFGEPIGESGNTGRSTGPHLHFQVNQNGHSIDPTPTIYGASVKKAMLMGEK